VAAAASFAVSWFVVFGLLDAGPPRHDTERELELARREVGHECSRALSRRFPVGQASQDDLDRFNAAYPGCVERRLARWHRWKETHPIEYEWWAIDNETLREPSALAELHEHILNW
jgi:hypothetical protein